MLYVVAAVLIIGSALFGCRPEERRLAGVIGIGAWAAFVPCLVVAEMADREVARGFCFGLLVVGAAQLAMLVGRRRPSRGGEDGGADADEPLSPLDPGPVDWPEFERRFWDEVERGPGRGSPSGPRERDRTPV